MSFFILGIEKQGRSVIRGLGRGAWGRDIQKPALKAIATHWHTQIFPKHFGTGNRSRYSLARRTQFYLEVIKKRLGSGQGRYVDLLLKGTSRRAMLHLATITGSKERQTVTMRPPRYFTNPHVGTFRNQQGRLKVIRQQPDKVAEVTQIPEGDRRELRQFAERALGRLLALARARAA